MDGTRTLISIVQTCQHEVWYATDRRNETYILSRRHLKDSPLEKFDVVLCAVLDAELVLNDLIEPAAEPSVPSEATDSTPQRSFDLFCFDLLRWAGRDYAHKPFWIRHRVRSVNLFDDRQTDKLTVPFFILHLAPRRAISQTRCGEPSRTW